MEPLRHTEMLSGPPFAELLAKWEAELAEIIELAPDSSARLFKAGAVKCLREAIERARRESSTCTSAEAGEIMGVSERQATKLATAGAVTAKQKVVGGPWTYDVRSCHAYAARKGRGAA